MAIPVVSGPVTTPTALQVRAVVGEEESRATPVLLVTALAAPVAEVELAAVLAVVPVAAFDPVTPGSAVLTCPPPPSSTRPAGQLAVAVVTVPVVGSALELTAVPWTTLEDVTPDAPLAPAGPAGPAGPGAPASPLAPAAPAGPMGP
jgi:hypothetical protein